MNKESIKSYNENSHFFVFSKREILLKEYEEEPKFLSLNEVEKLGISNTEIIYIGSEEGNEYYAASLNSNDNIDEYYLKDIGQIYGEVNENIFFLALRGLHCINWLKKTKYCSCCGEKVELEVKKPYIECLHCGHEMHPFVNPCILVAVLKEDKILLARSPHFPPKLFSLIAGFVEAGENIENAVRREVREEVGIEIKNIKYFGSHPWPFSNSLMFGFIAEHSSGEIKIDNYEIEAADWYSLDDLPHTPDYNFSFAKIIIDHVVELRQKPQL